MRNPGYYWCRIKDEWDIYYYSGNFWYYQGPNCNRNEKYFEEIDEKQIKRE